MVTVEADAALMDSFILLSVLSAFFFPPPWFLHKGKSEVAAGGGSTVASDILGQHAGAWVLSDTHTVLALVPFWSRRTSMLSGERACVHSRRT